MEPGRHPSLLTCVLRVDVAHRLEMSLQQGWEALAAYENRLTQDDAVPESAQALDSKRQELVVSAIRKFREPQNPVSPGAPNPPALNRWGRRPRAPGQ